MVPNCRSRLEGDPSQTFFVVKQNRFETLGSLPGHNSDVVAAVGRQRHGSPELVHHALQVLTGPPPLLLCNPVCRQPVGCIGKGNFWESWGVLGTTPLTNASSTNDKACFLLLLLYYVLLYLFFLIYLFIFHNFFYLYIYRKT